MIYTKTTMENSTSDPGLTDSGPTGPDLTGLYLSECCRTCQNEAIVGYSLAYLIVTACVAFVTGVIVIPLIIFVLKLKREKKLCFREKEEPFQGKWEGASKRATIQVLKKHTLERDPSVSSSVEPGQCLRRIESEKKTKQSEFNVEAEETTLTKGDKTLECVVVETSNENFKTADEATASSDTVSDQRKELPENVPTDKLDSLTEMKDERNDNNRNIVVEDVINTNETKPTERKGIMGEEDRVNDFLPVVIVDNMDGNTDVNTLGDTKVPKETECVLRHESHLYEKSRGSSVYEHDDCDLVFQNDNFRISVLSNI